MATATIQLKRDTSANWAANNPVLHDGEVGVENTTYGLRLTKIGDGVTAWNSLPYEGISVIAQGKGLAGNQTVNLSLPYGGLFLLTFHGTGTNIEDFHTQLLQWNGSPNVSIIVADLINGNYNQTADNPPGHLTVTYTNGYGYVPGGSAARPSYVASGSGNFAITADSSIAGWSYGLIQIFGGAGQPL